MSTVKRDLNASPSHPRQMLSAETVAEYLMGRGILPDQGPAQVTELAGGVSNVVLGVRRGKLSLVVKQSLPRLRVADEWVARQQRILAEAKALKLVAEITPGVVPGVVDVDPSTFTLTLLSAPPDWRSWKTLLLAGHTHSGVAAQLGSILAAWHTRTDKAWHIERSLRGLEAFDELRVDPYYRCVMDRCPDLRQVVGRHIERMLSRRLCLVHGDYSPKNVLVGDGIWVVDFEVAHFGDPVFDVAFMMNHLMLKAIHTPSLRPLYEQCLRSFWHGYRNGVRQELVGSVDYVFGHIGCLMLARVVGKSPAEYLTSEEGECALSLGRDFLCAPPETFDRGLARVWRLLAS